MSTRRGGGRLAPKLAFVRRRVTSANLIALVALFVALGGSSYAALAIPKASVGAKQLKRNSVKAKQIAKNAVRAAEIQSDAVRSSEVRNGSLLAGDFAAGQLPGGEKGDKGERGDKGDPGANGATNVTARTSPASSVPPSMLSLLLVATCAPGERAVGGGIRFTTGAIAGDRVATTLPMSGAIPVGDGATPDGWGGRIFNSDAATTRPAQVTVVCAAP
jgi:hypothetical protein